MLPRRLLRGVSTDRAYGENTISESYVKSQRRYPIFGAELSSRIWVL